MWLGSRIWPRGISYSVFIYRYRLWYHGMVVVVAANACLYGNSQLQIHPSHILLNKNKWEIAAIQVDEHAHSLWVGQSTKTKDIKFSLESFHRKLYPYYKIEFYLNHCVFFGVTPAVKWSLQAYLLKPIILPYMSRGNWKGMEAFNWRMQISVFIHKNSYFYAECNNSFESTSYYWQQT